MGIFDFLKKKKAKKQAPDDLTTNFDLDRDNTYDDTDNLPVSVEEAAAIWEESGKDEDCTFGYTEEELEETL